MVIKKFQGEIDFIGLMGGQDKILVLPLGPEEEKDFLV